MSPVFDVLTPGFRGDTVDFCLTHLVKSNFALILGTYSRNVLVFVSNTISTGGVVSVLLLNV
jgi:hypothetical protein